MSPRLRVLCSGCLMQPKPKMTWHALHFVKLSWSKPHGFSSKLVSVCIFSPKKIRSNRSYKGFDFDVKPVKS